MSLMHLILIAIVNDTDKFKEMYAPFAVIFNMIFLILTCYCVIFGFTVTLIYKAKSE